MGYMRHHAIVVTGFGKDAVTAHRQARKIFPKGRVSSLGRPVMNQYRSFFISPDGSKEGWDDSNIGDEHRATFISWLHSKDRDSFCVDWVEVQFGDDNRQSIICNHSDM